MSLSVVQLALDGFRGYTHFQLDKLSRLTILVGPNAVGKTNIIEALELLCAGESFRRPAWSETITWGCEHARAEAVFEDGPRHIEHRLDVQGNAHSFEVNGKKKSAAQLRGTCPCVLFIPDDLQMVKAASARRRDALDSLGTQLSKSYGALKSEYGKTLRQRNLLIKDELDYGSLFDSWTDTLAVNGARLCVNRMRLFRRLAHHMERIYSELVGGERLSARYLPSWMRFDEMGAQIGDVPEEGLISCEPDDVPSIEQVQQTISETCTRLRSVEHRRRTSLVGPHKDEVVFFIEGKNARLFGSQGQQRTIVLCWKLAEVELVSELLEKEPILLLDDVMSELDERHRDALTGFIERSAQTFITTTNLGYFSSGLLEGADVVELPIPGTRLQS